MNLLWPIKEESYKKGTVLSVLFNIFSKGTLFLLTIIIARYFGSNIKTDIYFFVFSTMILFSGFINCIDTAVLIPESIRIREMEGEKKSQAFLNFFLVIYCFIGIVFLLFMYFFGPDLFSIISRFSAEDIALYNSYFWAGSFFFLFHILTNYLNNVLTSYKYFSLPMAVSSIKSCIAIACIFLLKSNYDVLSVFFAGIIGYSINLLILLFILKKQFAWQFGLFKVSVTRITRNNIFFAELGQIATFASSMFPLYLLSGFGSGIISLMNYGKNIADIPNTLITTQLSNVSAIKLNEEAARKDSAAMNSTFLLFCKLLVFILVPFGFFLFVFSEPIVRLFYASKNFNTDSLVGASIFLKLFAVSVFSIGINAIVSRVFMAVQAIKQAFIYQLVLNVFLIFAIWACTKYYGAYGYPIAIIVVNVVNVFSMYFICRNIAYYINYLAVIRYSIITLLVNACISSVLYLFVIYTSMPPITTIAIGFIFYLLILIFFNKKLNLNQWVNNILKNAT